MYQPWKLKKYLVKLLKVVGWITLSIVVLLMAVILLLRVPSVQNRVVQAAVGFLHKKIGTEVRLDYVSVQFPKKIVLEGLYVEDQQRDTLLYAGKLGVDTDLWGLTQKKIELNQVQLDGIVANIHRTLPDSAFNFDYIIAAFTAPDTTTVEVTDTTAAPWVFTVEDVALTNTRAVYTDAVSGMDLALRTASLEVSMDEFDLEQMIFRAASITIEDTRGHFIQHERAPAVATTAAPSDTTQKSVTLGFESIRLQRIHARYEDLHAGQALQADIADAGVDVNTFDLDRQIILLNELTLRQSFVSYHQLTVDSSRLAPADTAAVASTDTTQIRPWQFGIENLQLADNILQYDNFNQPLQPQGVDFNHFWLTQFNFEGEDLTMKGLALSGTVEALSFRDKSGFALTGFESRFAMTDHAVRVEDFHLTSPRTTINLDAQAAFTSFETLSTTYPDASIEIALTNTSIALEDIRFLLPSVLDSLPINMDPRAIVRADLACSGKVKDLRVERLTVRALSNTTFAASGTVKGLPDVQQTQLALQLTKLHTTRTDIQTVVADSVLPKSITLPEWLDLTGNFGGTLTAPVAKATLKTDLGSLDADLALNLDSLARENYRGSVSLNKFNLGKLLQQDSTLGILDLDASAQGRGLKLEDIDAALKLTVHELQYSDYTYKDFRMDGTLKKFFFSGTALLHDPNLDVTLRGDLDYQGNIPRYKLKLELKNADFQALHLSERPLRTRGTLEVDLVTADFKVLNGNVDIRKFAVFNGSKLYRVDSLLFVSVDQKGTSKITVRSDILSGDFEGTINLASMPEVLTRHINQYFSLRDTTYQKPAAQQDFKFALVIKNTDLLTEIIFPELEPFVPGEIAGEFDSRNDKLDLRLNLSRIRYSSIALDSVGLVVTSDKQSLDYTFRLKKVSLDTLHIEEIKLTGDVLNDSIHTRLIILDSLQKEKYLLGGVFNSFEDAFQFRFLPGQVMLNYEDWKTPLYNTLRFTAAGIVPNNFYIAKGPERILLVKQEDRDSTLSVVFNQVDLRNITSIVEGTTPLAGVIDGDVTLSAAEGGSFNSTAYIHGLEILERGWGDLALQLGKTAHGPFNVDLRLEGDDIDVVAAGYFVSNIPKPEIHFTTTLHKLDLASVEPLTLGQVKNLKGQLTGEVKVDGESAAPKIDGALRFRDAEFIPALAGSKFLLKDEVIKLTGTGLTLDDFTIRDVQNNTARFDGTIRTVGFAEFDLNLRVNAQNFQLLNTQATDNDLFYGNVRINTKAIVTGTSNLPKIQMEASMAKDSEFTYVVPQSEKGVLEQQGIVEFVDRDAEKDPFLNSLNLKDTVKSSFKGIDLTANIELEDSETFSIVIDPVTGDKLSVKGNSTLTLDISPSGDMQLSGRYEVTEGTYNLSFYKLVKREFKIEKGSYIMWSGDIMGADLNLRAIYEVETSPIDLVAAQLTTGSQQDLRYRQRLPFLVYLNIKGDLMTPDISFELDMPQEEQDALGGEIYARIKDINTRESDLNKQVFALLVLKRFISENPFETQGGSDVSASARRSVSKLLTEQLNRLSDNVKGVELTVDLKSYEDYSSGQAQGQTQLQLGLSKTLFDERLVVKVSGNVDVEGETSNQNSVADYIGDLALEYKLTPDGRLRVTGFRNSNYDMIDGELIETGAGFIYIKDYDVLRELFKSNATEK
ncbi:translocation/assembly module TamB domain-containing protein [Dawidia soli]|uniref:Translocation/assembly module TamB domain-containing protein n=1 Tax=Dawidia soli TaxID=2782352 RepID=A0AAP2DHL2_9BACT|nr:translocation/assembly module TamB domain-containing protein [Dawidia soli]MBT1690835.1 translocation/assembly module TamB domain-containing protein [Dawidia soli]